MASNYSVSLERVIKEFSFEILHMPKEASDLFVTTPEVNRPGLLLAGRDDYFDPARVQLLGLSELEFLNTLSTEQQTAGLKRLTERSPSAI